MPAANRRVICWALALAILAMVPVIWRVTVSPWQPDIAGLYSFRRALFNIAVTIGAVALVYLLLGRKALRHKVLVLVSQAVALGALLVLLEIPALLFGFNYQELFNTAHDATELEMTSRLNQADPILIHLHWPHSSFSGEVIGNLAHLGVPRPARYKANVRYDGRGFRNDRDLSQADIVVIGDSFVEAAMVAWEDTLVGQLERRTRVPTSNLGQIAYGLRQELEELKRFAIPLSPKLVVWVLFGGNDLRDVEFYERQLQRYGKPRPPVPLEQRMFSRAVVETGGRLLVVATRNISGRPSELALKHSGLYRRSDGVTERVYFGQTEEPWTPHQWNVAVSTLEEAHRLSRDQGAEFVVVYVPRKFRVYRKHLTMAEGETISTWSVNDLPEALAHWCADKRIRYLDTTPALQAVAARGDHPYFVDDVHWNALGHATATSALTHFLESERVFPFDTKAGNDDLSRK